MFEGYRKASWVRVVALLAKPMYTIVSVFSVLPYSETNHLFIADKSSPEPTHLQWNHVLQWSQRIQFSFRAAAAAAFELDSASGQAGQRSSAAVFALESDSGRLSFDMVEGC